MKKIIITITILVLITILIFGVIYINYKADVDAINNLNVNLNDIEIYDIKFSSFKLNFDIEIMNPSDRDIIDLSTDFKIYIEDNYIGNGNFSNVNILNNSYENKEVVVTIYYDGLADAVVDVIKNMINEGEFNIEIKGKIFAKALFGISIIEQNYKTSKIYK